MLIRLEPIVIMRKGSKQYKTFWVLQCKGGLPDACPSLTQVRDDFPGFTPAALGSALGLPGFQASDLTILLICKLKELTLILSCKTENCFAGISGKMTQTGPFDTCAFQDVCGGI